MHSITQQKNEPFHIPSISEMTYNVSSGTLNPTYHSTFPLSVPDPDPTSSAQRSPHLINVFTTHNTRISDLSVYENKDKQRYPKH